MATNGKMNTVFLLRVATDRGPQSSKTGLDRAEMLAKALQQKNEETGRWVIEGHKTPELFQRGQGIKHKKITPR